jgi:hypothetical protein
MESGVSASGRAQLSCRRELPANIVAPAGIAGDRWSAVANMNKHTTALTLQSAPVRFSETHACSIVVSHRLPYLFSVPATSSTS